MMDPRKLILICHSGGQFIQEQGSLSYKYNGGVAHAVDVNQNTSYHDLNLELADTCNLDLKTSAIKYFLPGNSKTLITVSNDRDLRRMIDFHGDTTTAECYLVPRETLVRNFPNKLTPTRRICTPVVAVTHNEVAVRASEFDIGATGTVALSPLVTASALLAAASTEAVFSNKKICMPPLITPNTADTMPDTLPIETVTMSPPITVTTPSAAATENISPPQMVKPSPIVSATSLSDVVTEATIFHVQNNAPSATTLPPAVLASSFATEIVTPSPTISSTTLPMEKATPCSTEAVTPSPAITATSQSAATTIASDNPISTPTPTTAVDPTKEKGEKTKGREEISPSLPTYVIALPATAARKSAAKDLLTPKTSRCRKGVWGVLASKEDLEKTRVLTPPPTTQAAVCADSYTSTPVAATPPTNSATVIDHSMTTVTPSASAAATAYQTPSGASTSSIHFADSIGKRTRAATSSATVIDHSMTTVTPSASAAAAAQNPSGASTSSIHYADSIGKRTRAATRRYAGLQIYSIKEDVLQQESTGPNVDIMQQGCADSKVNKLNEMNDLNTVAEMNNLNMVADMNDLNMVADADIDGQHGLIASWKKGITDVGQQFSNARIFRDVLQRYAIAHRFLYTFKKNEAFRVTVKCKTEGCPWRIHASWVKSKKHFRIKRMNKSHTCEGISTSLQPQAVKDWLIGLVKDKLQINPQFTPREIGNEFERDFDIQLNYYQAYRAIELAREQLQGSYKEAYNLLPWFVEKVLEMNPGSVARITKKEGLHFQRLFVSYHASLFGFQSGCRPVLFLDATSLMSKYHEVLLAAFGVDGEDGTFPVAFAVVDVEDDDSWHWFLEQLKSVVPVSESITFVSDKHKGLSKYIHEIFGNAHHGYSIHHLMKDFKRNMTCNYNGDGKGSLPGNFLAAAHAFNVDEFNKCLERIRDVSLEAYNWILKSEPEYWANSQFKGEPYNQVTCDVMESFKNWVVETRALPIIKKMDVIQSKVMQLICDRREDSSKWCTRLTPSKEAKLREESQKARALKVLFSSDSVFEVHEVHADSINVVKVDEYDCSCQEWKKTGLPCCHAISVFNCINRSPYDYCPRYFVTETAKLAYSELINLTPEIGKFDEIKSAEGKELHPPYSRTRLSDAGSKRKDPDKRPHTCSGCKEEGHHRTTCKIQRVQ